MSEKSFQDLAHTDDHLVEKRVSGEDVYSGIFLKMKRDTVLLPDGQQALREYLEHPGAVAILPILEDGRILV
ncbi:MAG: ADP-ribose pyrophosphatase, partial [Burkholderiaceae bacterium]|nr:ADP-ribose pyrophosphatase [Burkholderiaceae bacterium]